MRRHHRPHRHHHRHGRHRHGFDAWSASWAGGGRFFGPGEVRLALLSLLSGGPKHGYDLMKRLEARSGGMYKASAGTVYPTLQQLEDEGLVVSEAKEGKRVYQLTDASGGAPTSGASGAMPPGPRPGRSRAPPCDS
jgi:hypothetical protein